MATAVGCQLADLTHDSSARAKIKLENFVSDEVGLPTLRDIMQELAKPGRDPRKQFEVFQFADGVEKPTDLTLGIKLPGIVTNVTAFGAFVDIGVHQDGLVHISQLADKFVDDPNKVVKVGDKVQVTVTEVDMQRNRIALSMKQQPEIGGKKERSGAPGGKQGGRGSNQARGNNGNRSGNSNRGGVGNDFGNNWFDAALKK